MALTDWSVERPKQAFAFVMLGMVLLASGGMHLQFDNSEDGFFPDSPSVDLLNELESEYRANLDFIRVLDNIEANDLLEAETWERLATIEAMMLNRIITPSSERKPTTGRRAKRCSGWRCTMLRQPRLGCLNSTRPVLMC